MSRGDMRAQVRQTLDNIAAVLAKYLISLLGFGQGHSQVIKGKDWLQQRPQRAPLLNQPPLALTFPVIASRPCGVADAIAGPTPCKLGADDYFRMIDAGILGKEDRVELIDGDIVEMAPISQGHAATASALTHALAMACLDRALVGPNNPVRPDLALG